MHPSYVLIGSANVNQRSLGGNRDTEIAVGAYQPGRTAREEGDPRGDVHTYREDGHIIKMSPRLREFAHCYNAVSRNLGPTFLNQIHVRTGWRCGPPTWAGAGTLRPTPTRAATSAWRK